MSCEKKGGVGLRIIYLRQGHIEISEKRGLSNPNPNMASILNLKRKKKKKSFHLFKRIHVFIYASGRAFSPSTSPLSLSLFFLSNNINYSSYWA